ncbi:MAG TPA: TIGR03617 family F420-dependent LLM class oxidoreductase [Trebonia sp.]|nr:TIGR03617 family F420-dependent LLM class oxidoreductase [Trebonia sp.]
MLDPAADPAGAAGLEAAGFDGGWVTETLRDPYLYVAAAAGAARTFALGTGVAIAFARSPMTTALCAHDVQRLSGGRLKLGLGSQIRAHITRRFSMPWSHPARRMREYVLALRAIWASWSDGAPLDFAGEFYTHTLMTPFFNPGPSGYPPPPVLLGGVGAQMTAVAGEVADGFICGPLTSELSFREQSLAALEQGFARRATAPAAFETCVMPLVVTGSDLAETSRAAAATRARIAFYASTPAYRRVLELHGWGSLHERLHALSRDGAWTAMADLVDDTVLATFAVVAEPGDVAAEVERRFGGLAQRAILHAATDLGLPAWQAVLAAARPEVSVA